MRQNCFIKPSRTGRKSAALWRRDRKKSSVEKPTVEIGENRKDGAEVVGRGLAHDRAENLLQIKAREQIEQNVDNRCQNNRLLK